MKKIMFNENYGLETATLKGNKTMTRRNAGVCLPETRGLTDEEKDVYIQENSRYKIGEIVAIAQSYKDCAFDENKVLGFYRDENEKSKYFYFKDVKGWSNKMFVRADLMPHHIRITDIKMERLRDISEEDCLREGITKDFKDELTHGWHWSLDALPFDETYQTPREAFAALIDKVSGKGTWEANPWVFAYSFELVD